MNMRYVKFVGFAGASVLAAQAVFGAVTPEVVGTEWRVTVAKGGEETLTSADVADLKAKYEAKTVTVFKKLGEGTLNGCDLDGYAGPIEIAEGIYAVTSEACLGSTAGATSVGDGASLMINKSGFDVSQEHLILSGTGYDGKGVLRLVTPNTGNSNVNVSRVTLEDDCLFASDSGVKQGFTFSNTAYDFDMKGHTLTLNPGANTAMQLQHIVNAGHFVNLKAEFWINSGAKLDHGPEHTITIAGTTSYSDISFWNNNCSSREYNWKVIFANANAMGMTGNLGWRWFGPIEVPAGMQASMGANAGKTIELHGSLTGAGKVVAGAPLKLYADNSAFTGSISSTTYPVCAYTLNSLPGNNIEKVSDGCLYWMCRSEGETLGLTANDLRDSVFPKYSATERQFGVGVTANKTFSYPYEIPSANQITAYCVTGGGTFEFESPELKSQAFRGGRLLVTGTNGVLRSISGSLVVKDNARLELKDLAAECAVDSKITVKSPKGEMAELVFSNSKLEATANGNTFLVGSDDGVTYAKAVVEFGAGSAVTNDFLIGSQSADGAASAVYVRPGAYVRIARNSGVTDTTVGGSSQGFLEQTGGTVAIDMYTQFGRYSNGYGQHYISGGTCTSGQGYHMSQCGRGCYYQTGGTFTDSGSVTVCDCSYANAVVKGAVGDMTVDGVNALCNVAGSVILAQRNDCVATLNINNGGTLKAQKIYRKRYGSEYTSYKSFYTGDIGYVNFNGGTSEVRGATQDIFGVVNGASDDTGAKSSTWPTAVTIFPKGATIKADGSTTANVSASLKGAVGQGVTSIPMPDGLATKSYIAPPRVVITGNGTGATAVTTINTTTRRVTGIVVTSPGWGYTTATAKISMGGLTDSYDVACTLGDVTGGGLTKTGTGTLVLQTNNTYVGATTIQGGKLKLAAGSSISAESPVVVASGATLEIANNQTNFKSITGAGSVAGSYTPTAFVADFANATAETPAIPHASGTLTLNGQTVTFKNMPTPLVRTVIPIASAASIAGETTGLQLAEQLPDGWLAKFVVETTGGTSVLKVKVRPPKCGFVLMVR